MTDERQQEATTGACCTALMIPAGFFITAVVVVALLVVTDVLRVDTFAAALYVLGLQVLFLALFSVVYAMRSDE